MTKNSNRKERTLPGTSLSADDVEKLGETNEEVNQDSETIIDLPPLRVRAAMDEPEETPIGEIADEIRNETVHEASNEATNEEFRQAELGFQQDEPPVNEARPSLNRRVRKWAGPLKVVIKALLWIVAFPFLCILPFIVVLRIAVVSYQESTYAGWESLGMGMLAAVLLVCVYIAAFMWTFGIRRRLFMPLLNAGLTAMLFYSGYALFHLATSNAKTAEVRSYYTSLHPFLRVALKNLTFADESVVITDTFRTKSEYRSMGLKPREYSLHFRQPTGFVHAVDIRTNGRPKVVNLLVELYFILMGFETIRHVGTADHLHVALPLIESDTLAASTALEEKE